MKKAFLIVLLAFPLNVLAGMFCPNSFNQIDIGDTIDKVKAQCGEPTSMKTSQATGNQPQEWSYFIAVKAGEGSLKMTVAFVDGKLVNIVVNGTSLVNTTICNNIPVRLGDTPKMVEAACGKPSFITQNTAPSKTVYGEDKPTEITELVYGSSPATTFVFENGKLTERK